MRIDRSTLVFFDASCLIAAAGSPQGGSGFLLSLCEKGLLRACVSQPVLLEAERNIVMKLDDQAYFRYQRFLAFICANLIGVPSHVSRYRQITGDKDAHVVAAALQAGAAFLLTLDRNLIARVNEGRLPLSALPPGDFIKTVIPEHVDFPVIGR